MSEGLEKLIKMIYRKRQDDGLKIEGRHPDEEALACFLEAKLPPQEAQQIKAHLLTCGQCLEIVAACLELKQLDNQEVPEELMAKARESLKFLDSSLILEIALRLKEKALELLNTTGDVLVGQELVPAAILRSRHTEDFKDEVVILKDFQDISVEVKVENKQAKFFNFSVTARQKQTKKVIKDLRVTLIKDDLELESRLSDTGIVTFEHVLLGRYKVEINTLDNQLAAILLEIIV